MVTLPPVAPVSRVAWARTHRLILSHFPPIDLFDDIADPRDWELLAAAEARTNPRIYDRIGDLARVPPARRLSGPGASWVMAAFTHASPDRPSRFSDGSYGVYYAGDSLATALQEHAFHMGRFYARTNEAAGWIVQVRELVGAIDAMLHDLRGPGWQTLLHPDPVQYDTPQRYGARARDAGADGIVYPSLRNAGGQCIAAFWPDVVTAPMQGDHFRYHWNGNHIDYARRTSGERLTYALRPT